jgi:DNA-binding Lrp family transcriptional regulator
LERGLLKNYRIFWIGDTKFPLTNFDYYKPKDKTWKFDWKGWLDSFATSRAKSEPSKQSSQVVSFDKKDLIILKELVKNARTTLADLSKLLSLTLPAAKYRFDRLVERGLIQEWVIDLLPYAPQISELSEVRLDFKNEGFMRGAEPILDSLPIVQSYSPITGLNSITARLYLPRSEVSNLHTFLSLLVSKGVLTSYSYIVIDPMTIQAQTFAYKDYNDDSGWNYASREYLKTIDNLMPKWNKTEIELSQQALPSLSLKL